MAQDIANKTQEESVLRATKEDNAEETREESVTIEAWWEHQLVFVGLAVVTAIFLVAGLILYQIPGFLDWNERTKWMPDLVSLLVLIVSLFFAYASARSSKQAERVRDEIKQQNLLMGQTVEKLKHTTTDVQDKVDQLGTVTKNVQTEVKTLVDVSRKMLNGIPAILSESVTILRNAEDDIWLANFTLRFGAVHYVKYVFDKDKDESREAKNFRKKQTEFWDLITDKIRKVRSVRILTLHPDRFSDGFLEALKNRDGYEEMDIQKELKDMQDAYFAIKETASHREVIKVYPQENSKGITDNSVVEPKLDIKCANNLPLQMLIAKRRTQDEDGNEKQFYSCLVFFVGTENLEAADVQGLYTEHIPVIQLFMSLYSSFAESQTKFPPIQP